MEVDVLASNISDNYFYVVSDKSGAAALVDPIDGQQAVRYVEDHGLNLEVVINTHFHPDHIGGNDTVFGHAPDAALVTGQGDAERVANGQSHRVDRRLSAGDVVRVGDLELEVLDTPGHTPGHISLQLEEHLFCGDTIFVGGAGNCKFGGDAGVLFRTFRDVLRQLAPDTVFYPGHDYSVRNLEFILSIEPDNERAEELLADAKTAQEGGDIFLTTLAEERDYNPFMRFDDDALAEGLAAEHGEVFEAERQRSDTRDEAVFRTIRELRNRW